MSEKEQDDQKPESLPAPPPLPFPSQNVPTAPDRFTEGDEPGDLKKWHE